MTTYRYGKPCGVPKLASCLLGSCEPLLLVAVHTGPAFFPLRGLEPRLSPQLFAVAASHVSRSTEIDHDHGAIVKLNP
jgi:hypothetical protein